MASKFTVLRDFIESDIIKKNQISIIEPKNLVLLLYNMIQT